MHREGWRARLDRLARDVLAEVASCRCQMSKAQRAVHSSSCPSASRQGVQPEPPSRHPPALRRSLLAAAQVACWAVLAAALPSGCFAPDVGQFSCEIRCTAACESPLECVDGWCVLPGAPACLELKTYSAQPYEAACADGSLLTIELSPPAVASACVGDPIALTVSVVGGSPPYNWSTTGLDGVDLEPRSPSQSGSIDVSGEFSTPGRRDVTIEVRSGGRLDCDPSSLTFPVDVAAAPQIETGSLAEACVGEPYEVALQGDAAAGDESTWAVVGELPGGLRLDGDRLVGTPDEGGQFSLDVTLDAGRCQPARRSLSLTVRPEGECPRIQPTALAAPCEGVPYAQALSAESGQPPYQWRLIDAPAWLELDPQTASLHGVPAGAVAQSATLELQDAKQHVTRRTYSLAPRQSCYFAYVSQRDQAQGLHYADIFAARDVLVSRDVAPGASVPDFAFSPDGAHLAFRAGDPGELALYVYPTGSSTPAGPESVVRVPFVCPPAEPDAGAGRCSVLDYAWSGDSQRIAVVLGDPSGAGNALSGIDADAPELPFEPVAASYRQRLEWSGNGSVVFSGEFTGLPGMQAPSFAAFDAGAGAFAPPAAAPVLASAWEVRPTPTGAFFFEGNLNMVHLALSPQPSIEAHAPGWVSPSGLYAAEANDEGRLRLFAVGDPRTPLAESEPGLCEVVFAWAERSEVIACTRSESSALGEGAPEPEPIGGLPFSHGSALRIFQFRPGAAPGARLVDWPVPIERYFQVATAGHRRSFSPDGQWLAFYGEDEEGALILQAISALPDATSGFSSSASDVTSAIELGFAPTGDSFATYDDGLTRRFPPDRSERSVRVTGAIEGAFTGATPGACAEEFFANPARWCGSPSVPNHFRFSSDGASLLFEDGSHGLWLSDSSPRAVAVHATGAVLPECVGACSSRQYDFRPDAIH
jgi:WD40 repeat protein